MTTYVYPFIGGSMMASCVYHLLYFNGNPLGVSGIYSASLSNVLSVVRLGFSKTPPVGSESTSEPTSSETDNLIHNPANPNVMSSAEPNNTTWQLAWQLAFTSGLLAAGLLLRVLRPVIESHLGVPIVDEAVIKGISSTLLISLLSGTLVGIGSKAIPIFYTVKF